MKSRTVSMPGEMSRETGRETAGQAAPWKKCPECGGPYMVEEVAEGGTGAAMSQCGVQAQAAHAGAGGGFGAVGCQAGISARKH